MLVTNGKKEGAVDDGKLQKLMRLRNTRETLR
jgi:hypothetical protein